MNTFWHDGKVPNCLWEWPEATFSTCQNLLEMHGRRCLYLFLDFCSLTCTLGHNTFFPWCTSFKKSREYKQYICGRLKANCNFRICAAGLSQVRLEGCAAGQSQVRLRKRCAAGLSQVRLGYVPNMYLFLGQQPT